MDKSKKLSDKYTQEILKEIKTGIYANTYKLPSESEIAKQFGISRTLVRDCLSVLEREGFISRKHGFGTILNQHVLQVKTRIDLEQEFLEMITAADMTPKTEFVNNSIIEANQLVAKSLKIEINEKVLCSKRLISADNQPAIYCIDYIPLRNINSKEYDLSLLDKPVFEFLVTYCNTEVYMDLSEVKAIIADDYLANIFEIEKGSPLLYMNEIGYDFFGKPVLFSQEHYRDNALKHIILRKKI